MDYVNHVIKLLIFEVTKVIETKTRERLKAFRLRLGIGDIVEINYVIKVGYTAEVVKGGFKQVGPIKVTLV